MLQDARNGLGQDECISGPKLFMLLSHSKPESGLEPKQPNLKR